jgi:hypothetical protein
MSLTASRLEHACAFDASAWPSEGQLMAVVSTPEFVDLTLARTVTGVTFLCEGDDTLVHARQRLEQGYLSERARARSSARSVNETDTEPRPAAYGAAIWAAPQGKTWRERLSTIEGALEGGGVLSVLAATRVGLGVRPLRRAPHPGEPSAPCGKIVKRLRHGQWRLERTTRIGGIAGAWWAAWARLLTVAGQPHLADRAERAHHDAVLDARGASYVLLRARFVGAEA